MRLKKILHTNFNYIYCCILQVPLATQEDLSDIHSDSVDTHDGILYQPSDPNSLAASLDTPTHNPPRHKPASTATSAARVKSMASVDETDKTSVFSFFMERDFRYYFQHPYFRLFVAYFVTFLNFLIYAEDPVAHSEAECFIPVVGNCFAFVCRRYPDDGWIVLKVGTWILAMLFGLVVGKIIIHKLIFGMYISYF